MKEPEVFQDKVLTCVDCGKEFTWDAASQKFFRSKSFTNEPSRCQECRQSIYLRHAMRAASKGGKK